MISRIYRIISILLIGIFYTSASAGDPIPMTEKMEWKGRIVVKIADAFGDIEVEQDAGIALLGDSGLDALARQYGVFHIEKAIPWSKKPENSSITDISRYYLLHFPTDFDLHEVAEAYAENPYIITAEPYYIRKICYQPHDPNFTAQWALNTVNATLAYDYAQGSEDIIIGIVDSGIDTAHLDLRDNLWVNPGEDLNGNGYIDPLEWNALDDDNNGFVDDFWGWNFYHSGNNIQDYPPSQYGGHGTHCSGDADARTDNNIGIASLGWKAKIMTAKCGDDSLVYNWTSGYAYCVDNGANVISLSFGGYWSSGYEQSIINNAWDQGVLTFAAAGNDNVSTPHYPSAYVNVVAVAATNQSDQKVYFSNYGTWIDICAPGVNILSTVPNNSYVSWDGTSMACPISAGLACLIWSAQPEWTNQQVMQQIFDTCVDIYPLNPSYLGLLGNGRIDAGAALSGIAVPIIEFTDILFDDSAGNNDGRPDPGETLNIFISVVNSSNLIAGTNVEVTLTCDDPDIIIENAVSNLGNIPPEATTNNNSDPIVFSVDENAEAHEVTFTLTITDGATAYENIEEIVQMIGRPDVILIDDDGGNLFEAWYISDLDSLEVVFDYWDINSQGEIAESELSLYSKVIWFTSNEDDPINSAEEILIENFLLNNGRLFLTGEDIDEQMAGTSFYSDVLHANSTDSSTSFIVNGIEGDPITSGQTLYLSVGAGGAPNNYSASTIEPIATAVLIYQYATEAGAGIRWAGNSEEKLVYLPFCFEAVTGSLGSTPRRDVLANILNWFDVPSGVNPDAQIQRPAEFTLKQNFPNPFNPTTEISFSLPKAARVNLSVYDLNGKKVATLLNGETFVGTHRVIFQGDNLASGIYLYTLSADGKKISRKMVLIK